LAKQKSHAVITPAHVAFVLFNDPSGFARNIAEKAGADFQKIRQELDQYHSFPIVVTTNYKSAGIILSTNANHELAVELGF